MLGCWRTGPEGTSKNSFKWKKGWYARFPGPFVCRMFSDKAFQVSRFWGMFWGWKKQRFFQWTGCAEGGGTQDVARFFAGWMGFCKQWLDNIGYRIAMLVYGLEMFGTFLSPFRGNNHPNWLSFFSEAPTRLDNIEWYLKRLDRSGSGLYTRRGTQPCSKTWVVTICWMTTIIKPKGVALLSLITTTYKLQRCRGLRYIECNGM